jgi:hypothetical protein
MRMENHRRFSEACEKVGSEQRSATRSPVAMSARCRTDSGAKDYVALVDLSAEGCCLLSRQPLLSRGQRVTLSPDTLAGLTGRVQWTSDCLAGILFDKPLYGPVYEHLARTFNCAQPGSGSAAGRSLVDPSEAHRRELVQKIIDAETDKPQVARDADRYNRMVRETPGGSARPLPGGGRVMRLFY